MSMVIGKITAQRIPNCKFPPNTPDINPATLGPEEQPRSPASARRANIVVPPNFTLSAARENVPGQNTPTEKPQRIQPIRPTAGEGERPIMR